MAERAAPTSSPYTSATDKLRETTKWLFTGIVVTAGAIFAGSSLTNLGSLDAGWRLVLAAAGLMVGFAGLARLAHAALKVLTVDLGTPRMIAQRQEFAKTRAELDKRYEGSWTPADNFADFVRLIDDEFQKSAAERDDLLLERGRILLQEASSAASFLIVRERFDRLVRHMWSLTVTMIVGFGLFAWAANPPDKAAAPERGIEFKITY